MLQLGVVEKSKKRVGCALVVVALVAAVVAVGVWLGRKDAASKSPCERYAEVITRELDNCHSGVTRNHAHHIEICKESVDPTAACLEAIEGLSCEQIERGPAAFAEACRKGR